MTTGQTDRRAPSHTLCLRETRQGKAKSTEPEFEGTPSGSGRAADAASAILDGGEGLLLREAALSHRKLGRNEWEAVAPAVAEQVTVALGGHKIRFPAFIPDGRTFRTLIAARDTVVIGWARKALPEGSDEAGRSLDYLSACDGDRAAMARLSRSLRALQRPGSSLPEAMRDRAGRISAAWGRLAHATARNSMDPFSDADLKTRYASFSLFEVDAWADAQSLVLPPGGKKDAVPTAQDTPRGPSMRVLDHVGDAGSREGQDAARRFRALLDPMPLALSPDPDDVWRTLQAEFPWMEEANAAVAEAAALSRRSATGHFRLRPLMLVGPPGVGKTRWARRAAAACSIPFGSLSLAGMGSSMALTGAERGWTSAGPGYLGRLLSETGTANPLVLADEADKAAEGRNNGNALDALMPLLERESSSRHFDTYLLGNLNVSAVSWVLTANSLSGLPQPLLTRTRVIHAGRPADRHLPGIVSGLVCGLAVELGIPVSEMPDISDSLASLERSFASDACIRTLATALERAVISRIWAPPGPRAV